MIETKEKAREIIRRFYEYTHENGADGDYDETIHDKNTRDAVLFFIGEIHSQLEEISEEFNMDKYIKYWNSVSDDVGYFLP